jgi:hypothetical protein
MVLLVVHSHVYVMHSVRMIHWASLGSSPDLLSALVHRIDELVPSNAQQAYSCCYASDQHLTTPSDLPSAALKLGMVSYDFSPPLVSLCSEPVHVEGSYHSP